MNEQEKRRSSGRRGDKMTKAMQVEVERIRGRQNGGAWMRERKVKGRRNAKLQDEREI